MISMRKDFHTPHVRASGLAILGLLAATSVVILARPTETRPTKNAPTTVSGEKVLRFVRERFGIPDSTHMTIEPFRDAALPGYLLTTITVGDGNDKKSSPVTVSKNGRYLILSDAFTLGPDPKLDIASRVREVFKVPASVNLTVGDFAPSPYPGLLKATVTAHNGPQEQHQDFLVSSDKKYLLLGQAYNMTVNLRAEARRTLVLRDQPTQGPATAPVTIVEFADLECPTCAREHEFLEQQVVPRYGNKVRVVYKEFPLVQVHPWALTAALASQCVFQIKPSAYVGFRTEVFRNQPNINPANVRDLLLYYGEQAGVDRVKLAACVDSKASLSRVEENLKEGQALGVNSTPTFFINDRMMVGGSPPESFFALVDEALRGAH